MKRRRRKRNPGPALLLLGGAVVAAIGAAVAIFVEKKKSPPVLTATNGAQFATQPAFKTGLPDATGLLVGDCIVAVNGQAGFAVAGVPNGENTMLKITTSAGAGATSVVATSIDPRVTPAGQSLNVPTAAISGGGDCP